MCTEIRCKSAGAIAFFECSDCGNIMRNCRIDFLSGAEHFKGDKTRKQRLSPWSVKEAVDNAPCGVCFANAFDQIILCNSKMREVSKMLLGTKLQNYKMLHQAISEGKLREEIISMSSDGSVFAFPDGKVWMFQEYQLKDRETGWI